MTLEDLDNQKPVINLNPIANSNSLDVNSSPNLTDALTTALKFTLKWEGGLANHPNSAGGATNKGITQKTYNAYRINQKLPTTSVEFISDREVLEIYRDMYWKPSRAELMILPLAVVQFDTAVLVGVGSSIKFLQSALKLTADGLFGPKTEAALRKNNCLETAIETIDLRIAYHKQRVAENPKQKVFLQGWLRRTSDLKKLVSTL